MPELLLRPRNVPAAAWFGRYNFQRESDLDRLTTILTRADGPSVVLLSGEAGIGRRYLLQAAVHRLRQTGVSVEDILEIDLEGYDEEEVSLAKFLEVQVQKRRNEGEEKRKEIVQAFLSATRLGIKGTGWAALLSLTLSLREPAAVLRKLFRGDTGNLSGELLSAREVFASFVRSFSNKVILHVTDPHQFHAIPSPENPRRWLPELAERFPQVFLIMSCSEKDELTDVRSGSRNGVETISIHRLRRDEIQDLLDLRLSPNVLPRDLADTLLRYSGGLPGILAKAVWKLEVEDGLQEDEHRIWTLDEPKTAEILSEKLLDPVSQAFHEHPEHVQVLWKFLLDAALCGDLVPVNALIDLQGLAEDDKEAFGDVIDEELVENLGLFEDLQYGHPSFPAAIYVYRLRESISRLAVLEHFVAREKRDRAAQLVPALRRVLEVKTRDVARLFINLAAQLGEAEQDSYLRELEWWVGTDEADDLREGLIEAMAEGRLKPESLWTALRATEGRWPPYRRLALLDAYGSGPRDADGNSLGVPIERLGDFHYLRATLLLELDRLSEALSHAELSLSIREAQQGKNSLPVIYASMLLGRAVNRLGRLEEAETIFQNVLAQGKLLLSPEHDATLNCKDNLAVVLWARGKLDRARELLEDVLEVRERILGYDHPESLRIRLNVGSLLEDQGEYGPAREILEEVLKIYIPLMGKEHVHTLTTKQRLARVLQHLGELDRARVLLEEILESWNRIAGPEHHNTLSTKHNLASLLGGQGDLGRARELLEEILEVRNRLLGGEHPNTLTAKFNLARVLQEQGGLDHAQEQYEDVLRVRNEVLGPEHPHTLLTKQHLGLVIGEKGDSAMARQILEEVFEAQTRRLGSQHPDTLRTKRALEKP